MTQGDNTLNTSKPVTKFNKPSQKPATPQGDISAYASGAADLLVKSYDCVFPDNSDQERLNKEGGTVDEAVIAATQKSKDSLTLRLHNSFDLLHDDRELPSGEVMLVDTETNHISKDTLLKSAEIVDEVSKEIVILNHVAHSEVSGNVEIDSSEPAIMNSKITMLGTDIGTVRLPTPVPTSYVQQSMTADVVLTSITSDPFHDTLADPITYGAPILSPVTFVTPLLEIT